jgi:hypothetical protein
MAASPTTLATCIVRDTVIESTSTDAGQVPRVTFPQGPGESWLRRGEDALGTGGAFRDVPSCLLRILSRKRLLSRSLSFDAFVLLLVPTSYVSLPQVQCARLLLSNCMTSGRQFFPALVTFPHAGPDHSPSARP